ncbi:hypothetical protein JCGZ_09281 [Jatropha curcas]|uniref:Uncharacterized protein n=1 Tax=Jatropha curcas TaxID=180498 RepID=A0A067KIZ2_JATCU|nr:hypothetical protein JCGZ_09281 [Jatropha curcas]
MTKRVQTAQAGNASRPCTAQAGSTSRARDFALRARDFHFKLSDSQLAHYALATLKCALAKLALGLEALATCVARSRSWHENSLSLIWHTTRSRLSSRNHVDKAMSRHRIADLRLIQFVTPATGR